ncbi:MAG: hypothetical protein Q8Q24_01780 [bacterium]|nr:hypothetical protein [bacterium]
MAGAIRVKIFCHTMMGNFIDQEMERMGERINTWLSLNDVKPVSLSVSTIENGQVPIAILLYREKELPKRVVDENRIPQKVRAGIDAIKSK